MTQRHHPHQLLTNKTAATQNQHYLEAEAKPRAAVLKLHIIKEAQAKPQAAATTIAIISAPSGDPRACSNLNRHYLGVQLGTAGRSLLRT